MGIVLAERFPAGEFLREELEARGWSQADFAEIIGRPTQYVSEIVSSKKEITREAAAQFAVALGTSVEYWLNLQDSYFLWEQQQDMETQKRLEDIKTRAQLKDLAPVGVLKKRGYIEGEDVHEQTAQVLALFGKNSFEDPSGIRFAARRTNIEESVTVLQQAWAACVKTSGERLDAQRYEESSLRELAEALPALTQDPCAFADFQRHFSEVGVKLVYVEAFPGGKLDGCTMMVGSHPVIGLSGRGKRLDKIFFTLMHEVAHLLLGHVTPEEIILDDLDEECSETELAADRLASELILPSPIPYPPGAIRSDWVKAKAAELRVHPLLLIGRLQKEGMVPWKTTLVRNAPKVTNYLSQWETPLPAR